MRGPRFKKGARPGLLASTGPLLEHHFALDDHVFDQPLPERGVLLDPVLEAVVGDDARVELLGEGEDEVVGVGAGRGLLDDAFVDQPFVGRLVVDLVAERGVDEAFSPSLEKATFEPSTRTTLE